MRLFTVLTLALALPACIAQTDPEPVDTNGASYAEVEPDEPERRLHLDPIDRCAGHPSGTLATPQLLGPCLIERCSATSDIVTAAAPDGMACAGGACEAGVCQ